MTAGQAAELIKDGMTVVTSGFTPAGYPKAVPLALAKRVKQSKEKLQISLLTGASVGEELDGALTEADIITRRYPYQTNKSLRNNINSGKLIMLTYILAILPNRFAMVFLARLI